MATTQMQLGCARCQAVTPHNVETANHALHLLLSVFTLGLWLLVWIFAVAGSGKTGTCVRCGTSTGVGITAAPQGSFPPPPPPAPVLVACARCYQPFDAATTIEIGGVRYCRGCARIQLEGG